MSDTVGRGDPLEGEYTDSELPLDAVLPKEEYTEVEHLIDAAGEADDDELDEDVEVIEIVETDPDTPPDRQPPL